ncbi:aldehyde dehydrogenase family protein [Aneurinibacillus sp. Ricciae_BoGa-3]|uniref:aldehyde dehydrogenase family protein n=1 Tax=Aneurinibacillus sp. Ricciae_BoGa-3 TaxID=3022697 RepID=UPI002341DC2A|nr:aldehyde dehydrogenase family protein [Aneurinibacillus sp. Ricciae_BoGa-3]WCK52994.1 aldehyde dehydrogenase family protein [Aneurinibacillus sp. Ricciae_BoGa-3]
MENNLQWSQQFINGQWREGSGKNVYVDKNPYNDESVAEIKLANIDDINEAYESARAAQAEWEKINPYKRSAIVEKAAELLEERREELVELLVAESGSTRIKANVEISKTDPQQH